MGVLLMRFALAARKVADTALYVVKKLQRLFTNIADKYYTLIVALLRAEFSKNY